MDKRTFSIFEKISREVRALNSDQWVVLASPLARLNHWQSLLASNLTQGGVENSSSLPVWIYKIYNAYQGFRFLFSRRQPFMHEMPRIDMLVLSIWISGSDRDFKQSGIDPIWGDFVSVLQKNGQKKALLFIDEHHRLKPTYQYQNIQAYSLHCFLTFWDYLVIFYQMVTLKINLSDNLYKKSILKDIYHSYRAPIAMAMSMERALKRVIEKTQCQKIFLPFEGNSWEAGALRAAQEKHIASIGYQHTALPDEMTKLGHEVHEDQLPDYVMTSGAGATDRLISYFEMPEDRLITGVSFRKNLSIPLSPVSKDGYILILLQGLNSDHLFIHTATEALQKIGGSVRVRAHPACPVQVPTQFDVSHGTTLQQDISGARICLYSGTSACIEALLCGLPIIHIDCGLYPSPDPLSFMPPNPLKQNWHIGQNLNEMIENVVSIDAARRQEFRDFAIGFIHQMLTPATLENKQELAERITQKMNLP